MGNATNRRQLFDLSQAKAYMQTMLVASGCKKLIDQGKTTSLRGLFYMLKHTIEGTKENTFDDQGECDTIIEDIEVLLDALARGAAPVRRRTRRHGRRHHVHRQGRRDRLLADGLRRLRIPSIVEPEVIQFDRKSARPSSSCTSKRARSGSGSTKTSSGRSTTASSRTAAASRRAACGDMLHRLHNELKLPIYCVLDNDPWGYYIYSVIKQGSINLAFESQRMAIPEAEYLGLRSNDFERCQLSRQREDHAQRHRPQTGQANRQLSVVRQEARVAERNPKDAEERLQAGSRSR